MASFSGGNALSASGSSDDVMSTTGTARQDRECHRDMGDDDDLSGVKINPENVFQHDCTNMRTACMKGDLEGIKRLLEGLPEEEGRRLLVDGEAFHFSIVCSNLDIVEYLACHPLTNLEEASPYSFVKATPLIDACLHNNYEATEILLERGADPNHGSNFSTPLLIACAICSEDLVKLLLDHGADPNLHPITGTRQETSLPLYVACLSADLKVVEPLLEYLNKREDCCVSNEQMILCRSILGFRLIFPRQFEIGDISGWTFLRSAIEEFEKSVRVKHGSINQLELSRIMHKLYLKETYLVQTGKPLEVQGDPMFRTRARFPDFKLCIRSQDIDMNAVQPNEAACRHFCLIPACSSVNEYLSTVMNLKCDRLVERLSVIAETRMTKEDTRICLLVLLENTLHLHEEENLVDETILTMLSRTVINDSLFEHNPGYLMLILDILNSAVETLSKSAEKYLYGGKADRVKSYDRMMASAELFTVFTYLIIREDLTDQHTGHLAKIVNRYTVLLKNMGWLSTNVECQLLMVIANLLVSTREEFRLLQQDDSWVKSGLKLLQSLLRCGVDANSRDEDGNTVMVLAVGLPEPLRSDVIELLMAYGGHVDIANFAGSSPYQILVSSRDSRIDPLRCRTLKCRAASTVTFFKIPYVGKVPKLLEDFVTLHELYTPSHVADVNKAICNF